MVISLNCVLVSVAPAAPLPAPAPGQPPGHGTVSRPLAPTSEWPPAGRAGVDLLSVQVLVGGGWGQSVRCLVSSLLYVYTF